MRPPSLFSAALALFSATGNPTGAENENKKEKEKK
jgi:hypothetical protein